MPEVSDNLGIVLYGHDDTALLPGDKVYYGTDRELIRMSGDDVMVMDESNIVALVIEE